MNNDNVKEIENYFQTDETKTVKNVVIDDLHQFMMAVRNALETDDDIGVGDNVFIAIEDYLTRAWCPHCKQVVRNDK